MRIEFPELGDGYFVEIKDPNKLKWKEQKSLTQSFKEESLEASMEVAEKISIILIKSGHVCDEDNKPFTFPVTAESVGELPSQVIEEVAKKFAELKKVVSTEKN
jgi:hypothetical protein